MKISFKVDVPEDMASAFLTGSALSPSEVISDHKMDCTETEFGWALLGTACQYLMTTCEIKM